MEIISISRPPSRDLMAAIDRGWNRVISIQNTRGAFMPPEDTNIPEPLVIRNLSTLLSCHRGARGTDARDKCVALVDLACE